MTSLVPTIQGTPQNVGPAAFLRDLLNRWLNKGQPTLETLCKALRRDDEIIGGAGVANTLEETFRNKRGLELTTKTLRVISKAVDLLLLAML